MVTRVTLGSARAEGERDESRSRSGGLVGSVKSRIMSLSPSLEATLNTKHIAIPPARDSEGKSRELGLRVYGYFGCVFIAAPQTKGLRRPRLLMNLLVGR